MQLRIAELGCCLAALLCLLAGAVRADETPVANALRLPAGVAPPTIDGALDDPAWETATVIDAFRQATPKEGAEPSERTEVRITFDKDAIYVAFHNFDREPEALLAAVMARDQSLRSDDRVNLIFDTFHDHRNAVLFTTNPNGARFDGIIENNGSFKSEWDGIWSADSRIDETGWTCEFRIPFKTLSFDAESPVWGMNLMRAIRRRNEEVRWASARQNKSLIDVSEAGDLTGLTGIEQGVGLDFIPSTSLGWTHDRFESRSYGNLDPSFDAFYRVTPSVTAALTVNTDFSDTAVDTRQVNLSRFNLFFPETRDFFLQDAGIFDFPVAVNSDSANGTPFFSRRIGIAEDGDVVDLRAGAKVTGRVGPINFGLLDVQMAGHRDVDAKNLAVGRVKYNFGEESFLGLISTHGDPNTNGSNSLFGLDLDLRTSKLFGNRNARWRMWTQHTTTAGEVGDDLAWGMFASYPNDIWNWHVGLQQFGEDFNPALGFVNRVGIRNAFGNLRRRWRPEGSAIRIVQTELAASVVTDLGNDLESLRLTPTLLRLENQAGDYVQLWGTWRTEVLRNDFPIAEGVSIAEDRYDFGRATLSVGTAISRPLAVQFDFGSGSFFSGHIRSGRALLEWRVSKRWFTSLEYLQNSVRLQEGNFETRLGRVRLNLVFSPNLSWETFLQFDNISDSLGWNSRIRWIIDPGEEIVFVWNQAFRVEDYDFQGTRTGVTGKIRWTFRF